MWNTWKKQPGNCSWWSENSKCTYQEAFRDLDRACKAYWRARRVGRRVGFPKFKKKGRTDHFRLNDPVRVQPRAVVLPRIGPVRTKEATTKLQGRILSATCRREADRWYVSLCVRTDRPDPIAVKGVAVGIDRGLKTFAVLSNGDIIDSPQALERGLRKLRRLNKAVARKQPGSRRRAKARMAVARHHRRMRNRRRDALHKATTNLARTSRQSSWRISTSQDWPATVVSPAVSSTRVGQSSKASLPTRPLGTAASSSSPRRSTLPAGPALAAAP